MFDEAMAGGVFHEAAMTDIDPPRKRQRLSHSPDNDSNKIRPGRGDSYTPNHHTAGNSTKAQHGPHASSRSRHKHPGAANADRRNKKTKKERKENPSTRIASLRKQLNRGGLPPPVQRERERELAALLFEREKRNIQTESRKNLERYHFVRFIERQKASRLLKNMQKQKSQKEKEPAGDQRDQKLEVLTRKVHSLEVDLMYTKYAPLGEKYISLYPHPQSLANSKNKTPEQANDKPYKTKVQQRHMALLDEEQQDGLKKEQDRYMKSQNSIIHSSGNVQDDGELMKPPRWYEVEAAMREDEQDGSTARLDALRDGKATSAKTDDTKSFAVGLSGSKKSGDKRKQDWLDDNGEIDPADLDSDSDGNSRDDVDMQDGGVRLGRGDGAKHDDEGDDMSDGDGGFFEKR